MPPRDNTDRRSPPTTFTMTDADDYEPRHPAAPLHLQQPQLQRRRRERVKVVAFDAQVRCLVIENLLDHGEQLWFNDAEQESFTQDMKRDVRTMRRQRQHNLDNNNDCCFRGLEHLASKQVLNQRMEQCSSHIARILDAQCVRDASYVAQVSLSSSKPSKERAIRYGIKDAKEALL